MTNREILKKGEELLEDCNILEAKLNAWYLFSHVFSMEKSRYILYADDECDSSRVDAYFECIKKRSEHIPLEHITNETEFMGIEFFVNEDVLIPRQDTEILVLETMKYSAKKNVLDMCTGSGCIGISLALLGNCKSVLMSDVSTKALEVAKKNALSNNAKDVSFVQSDIFENIEDTYDVIVSNPPYIKTKEIDSLMEEVKDHDPLLALDGMEDGLYFYKKIVEQSERYLNDDGWLLFEIGYDQGKDVSDLMCKHGFVEVQIIKDLAGLDRVVKGRKGK